MADTKIVALPPLVTQKTTDIYEVSDNGAGSYKENRAQMLSYMKSNIAIAPYTIGSLIYADTIATLNKIVDVATGNVLLSGGVGVSPLYGKVGLTTHVTGVLPPANGGTGVNNGSSTITVGGNTSLTGASTFNGTLTGNTNVTFPTSGTLISTATLPAIKELYISPTGNDTTGTGSIVSPYATYEKARSVAALTASATNLFVIKATGVFNIAGNMLISPFISIDGDVINSCKFLISGQVLLHSAWDTTANAFSSINSCMMAASGDINLTFGGAGGLSQFLLFNAVDLSGTPTVTIVGSGGNATPEFVAFFQCVILGTPPDFSVTNASIAMADGNAPNSLTVINNSSVVNNVVVLQDLKFLIGNTSIQTTNTGTIFFLTTGSSYYPGSTLTIDGTNVTALIDASSYTTTPIFLNGASQSNISLLSISDGIQANTNFTPTNYTPSPDTNYQAASVTGNLAGIDNALATKQDIITLNQGELIMGITGFDPVAGNLVSLNNSIDIDVSTNGQINLQALPPVFPALNQGQLIMGVESGDPVAGDLTSSNSTINVNTSVDGVIDLTINSTALDNLQEAYDGGNTIQLAEDRPFQLLSVPTSSTLNSIDTPSSGTDSISGYLIKGWEFTASSNISITALQYLDAYFNVGGIYTDKRDVGIFVKNTSVELVQTPVYKTDPLVSGLYRTHTLPSPLLLQAGVSYVVATVVPPLENFAINNDQVPSASITVVAQATGAFSTTPIPLSCPTAYFVSPQNAAPAGYFQYEVTTPAATFSVKNGDDGDAAFMKVESTELGTALLPAMTQAQANLIINPYDSLQTWNTDTKTPYVYSDNQWKYITPIGLYSITGSANLSTSNNWYITQGSSLVTVKMPTANAKVGSVVKVISGGTGGFKIQLSAGQIIKVIEGSASGSTSSGGYVTSLIPPAFPNSGVQLNAVIEMTCIVENLTWVVTSGMGNLLYV